MQKLFPKIALVLIAWVVFWSGGIKLDNVCNRSPKNDWDFTDISAYDSDDYLRHDFLEIKPAEMIKLRHPLLHVFMLPAYPLRHIGNAIAGDKGGRAAIIGLFTLFGAFSLLLMWMILEELVPDLRMRFALMSLWLSFAHVWILGMMVESFGLALFSLLLCVLLVIRNVQNWRYWLAMAVLSGGITITNGIKPLLAGFATRCERLNGRKFSKILLFCFIFAVSAFALMMLKWKYINHIDPYEAAGRLTYSVISWLPSELSIRKRLFFSWQLFWCEPMLLHGNIIGQPNITTGYGSLLPHLLAISILALAITGGVVGWPNKLVKAVLAMITCDVVLHLLLGWGIHGSQIYCAHWFWSIPIFIAFLPPKYSYLILAVAAGNFIWNVGVVSQWVLS